MVQSQSTFPARAVTFSTHTSVRQPPGNCLFSWTPVNQSFFDKHKGHSGSRPLVVICGTGLYYTNKNLL